jgi:hypothetical protein
LVGSSLEDVKTRADRSLRAVDERIRIQLAAPPPASPAALPAMGQVSGPPDAAIGFLVLGIIAILTGLGLRAHVRDGLSGRGRG